MSRVYPADAIWTGETRPAASAFIRRSHKASGRPVVDRPSRMCVIDVTSSRVVKEQPSHSSSSELLRLGLRRISTTKSQSFYVVRGSNSDPWPESEDVGLSTMLARRTLDLNVSGSTVVDDAELRQAHSFVRSETKKANVSCTFRETRQRILTHQRVKPLKPPSRYYRMHRISRQTSERFRVHDVPLMVQFHGGELRAYGRSDDNGVEVERCAPTHMLSARRRQQSHSGSSH